MSWGQENGMGEIPWIEDSAFGKGEPQSGLVILECPPKEPKGFIVEP